MPTPIEPIGGGDEIFKIHQLTTPLTKKGGLSGDNLHVMKEANIAINALVGDLQRQPRKLREREIGGISRILYNLYISKIESSKQKENITNYAETADTINDSIHSIFKIFTPPDSSSFKDAAFLFATMFQSIRADAFEEVVGQERIPGAIPRLLQMSYKRATGKNMTEQQMKIASVLYPIALLSVYLDPKVPIPSKEKERMGLQRDREQFESEYRAQFGKYCSRTWSGETFEKSLKSIWDMRREEQP